MIKIEIERAAYHRREAGYRNCEPSATRLRKQAEFILSDDFAGYKAYGEHLFSLLSYSQKGINGNPTPVPFISALWKADISAFPGNVIERLIPAA